VPLATQRVAFSHGTGEVETCKILHFEDDLNEGVLALPFLGELGLPAKASGSHRKFHPISTSELPRVGPIHIGRSVKITEEFAEWFIASGGERWRLRTVQINLASFLDGGSSKANTAICMRMAAIYFS